MPKFTVILAYPDYLCAGGPETWCGTVEAPNAAEAVTIAQQQCSHDNGAPYDPMDLLPISVFEGEHNDLIGEWHNAR
jgi:hypothetical protein